MGNLKELSKANPKVHFIFRLSRCCKICVLGNPIKITKESEFVNHENFYS
jgi:ADP-dependent phosphofructokinase/glucokinase